LHAYLEGQNIELMANSDNVLRGGLTPKHVDIDELLKHINFIPTIPNVLNGAAFNNMEINYPCPVADFGLSKIALKAGEAYTIQTKRLEMLLVTEGEIVIDGIAYGAGEVALAKALQGIAMQASQAAIVFKSFVP
jgi:mannose-6-phosphate isomerase